MVTKIKNKNSFEMNKYTFIGSIARGKKKKPGANCRDGGLANNLWCLRPCGSRNVNRNHVKHSHCVYTASNIVSPLCCKQLKWLRPAGGEPWANIQNVPRVCTRLSNSSDKGEKLLKKQKNNPKHNPRKCLHTNAANVCDVFVFFFPSRK